MQRELDEVRALLQKYGFGTLLCAIGALLVLAGTGASLAYELKPAPATSDEAAATETRSEGLAAELLVRLHLLGDTHELPTAHVEPPAAESAPLPGASARRAVSIEEAGLGADVQLDLAAGSHRSLQGGDDIDAQSANVQKAVAPPPAAVGLAAAVAFTGAGVATYHWSSIKTWLARMAWFPLVPLYAKITRAQVFDNRVRERIFGLIKARPGVSASELAKAVGASWGTTIYHLEVLEQTRMVTSMREGRYRRYFENGAALTDSKQAVAILRNSVTAGVVETIRAAPGATQKELALRLGMSPQALHWHVMRLAGAGLVRKEREGRVVRHFPA